MVEHCLYGVKVLSDRPLFAQPTATSVLTISEDVGLELRPRGSDASMVHWDHLQEIQHLDSSHGRDLFLHTDRQLAPAEADQPWRLQAKGVVSFAWSSGQPLIEYELHEQGDHELMAFWFVHIFLPLHLTLERGWDFIHAAAVEVDEKPILFVAPSTGGKSTLGDYFLERGHPMLSDDKVATILRDHQFHAVPSHPYHRPYREDEVLGQRVALFAEHTRPIHAFYLLQKNEIDRNTHIVETTGFRKFEQLLPNYLFNFRYLQQRRLCWLAELADTSRVFNVCRPWDLSQLNDVYEAICAHSRSLGN